MIAVGRSGNNNLHHRYIVTLDRGERPVPRLLYARRHAIPNPKTPNPKIPDQSVPHKTDGAPRKTTYGPAPSPCSMQDPFRISVN
jgi:hypothetical protein